MENLEKNTVSEVKDEVLIDENKTTVDEKSTVKPIKKSTKKSQSELYTGYYKWIPTSDEWLDFEADGKLPDYMHLFENEYLLVYDESEPNKLNRQYVMKHGKLEKIGRSSITIKQCGYGSKNTNKTYMPKNDEQVCAFDLIKDRDTTVKLITGSWGSGKACPNSTVIPTPNGNKLLGELKVGDYVFDENGKPTKILGVFPQGKKKVYELTFNDGRKAKCCDDHLWTVRVTDKDGNIKIMTVTTSTIRNNDLINKYTAENICKFEIPRAKSVHYSRKQYKFQPYYFGKTLMSTLPIDLEILMEFPELNNKNRGIPEIYLLGDREQRRELFQGLTFICPHEDSGEKVFCASGKFKDDFLTLCYSLNYTVDCEAVIDSNGQASSKITVRPPNTKENKYLEIVDIQDLGYEEEMTCIYVENETHLFLMNDFIVTHNTMLLVSGALELLEHERFDRIIWIRNNVDVKDTKDLGALPGEAFEKLKPFLGPFIDHAGETRVMSMVQDGRLVVEPLQFLRGRNLENSLILCSEAENLTKEHIQLIIARAAEGSEVWLDGDCKQRDKLAFERSQGIETMIERFKGKELFGYVHLPKSERSKTAAMADLLD